MAKTTSNDNHDDVTAEPQPPIRLVKMVQLISDKGDATRLEELLNTGWDINHVQGDSKPYLLLLSKAAV